MYLIGYGGWLIYEDLLTNHKEIREESDPGVDIVME